MTIKKMHPNEVDYVSNQSYTYSNAKQRKLRPHGFPCDRQRQFAFPETACVEAKLVKAETYFYAKHITRNDEVRASLKEYGFLDFRVRNGPVAAHKSVGPDLQYRTPRKHPTERMTDIVPFRSRCFRATLVKRVVGHVNLTNWIPSGLPRV